MFGKLLSSAIKVVTLPVDAAAAGFDILAGGDGTKSSRTDGANPVGMVEELRDRVAEAAEDIDD
jgi:hypothetical protein